MKTKEAEECNEEAKKAYKEKDLKKAVEWLLRAANLCPIEGKYFINLGIVYNELEKYKEAVYCFGKAIEFGYEIEKSYQGRARAWSYLEENEKAIADYTEAIKINEDCVDARSNRGVVYFNSREYEKAIEDFDAVLEKKPDDMLAPLLRYAAQFNLGMKEEAKRDLENSDREWEQMNNPN